MEFGAQTNAQLFLQLHHAGCSGAELRRVRDAFLLAMQLYSGLFTGSGKTTLAHEIGTASLAHRYGGSFDLILAGLLHGAYLVGDWGHYRRRITGKKREALRSVIGERAETYVHEFTQPRWSAEHHRQPRAPRRRTR
jgi:(p)ppGpp synthase/HD superfamily hydrolase